MPQKVLVIVGMHRSGTSLITNWLEKCGLQVGERLEVATESNIDGHFEDMEFRTLHEEVLISKNLPSSGLVESIDNAHLSVYQQEKLKCIIHVKNKLYPQWGWKDPRTCLFLDTYRQLLPGSKYLVIVRDYQSVISSLLKRDFLEVDKKYMSRKWLSRQVWTFFRRTRRRQRYYNENAEHYLKVWLIYNQQILKAVKNLAPEDYLVLNYNVLEKSDDEVFNFLTNNWQFSLTHFKFKQIYKQSLMNNAKNIDALIKDATLIAKADYIQGRLQLLIKYN